MPSLLVRPTFFCGVGKIDLWLNGAIVFLSASRLHLPGGGAALFSYVA